MGLISRGWKGTERLWKVTWLGYVGGAIILAILLIVLIGAIGDAAAYIGGPLVLALNVWGLVAMWRCAPNVGWRGWFYLARIVVAITVIAWIIEVAGRFL